LCGFLGDDQIVKYDLIKEKYNLGFLEYYEKKGFAVNHIPTIDGAVISEEILKKGLDAYRKMPKPILVHCNTGMTRSDAVVGYIVSKVGKAPHNPYGGLFED
jgi:protein-tyrosine phosphatase